MIDCVKQKGISSRAHKNPAPKFFELIERNEQLIYHNPVKKHLTDCMEYQSCDAPFEVCSIEEYGRPLTSARPGEAQADVLCVLYSENPIELFCHVVYDGLEMVIHLGQGEDDRAFLSFTSILQTFFDKLPSSKEGVNSVRKRHRVGSGKTKKVLTLRREIHIIPDKVRNRSESANEIVKRLDFSHRFIRRGHWRKLEGKIGKNRAGAYVEKNRTWVNESRPIGDESKPLIKKVRHVHGTSEVKRETKEN
jgi:hypothetical protein